LLGSCFLVHESFYRNILFKTRVTSQESKPNSVPYPISYRMVERLSAGVHITAPICQGTNSLSPRLNSSQGLESCHKKSVVRIIFSHENRETAYPLSLRHLTLLFSGSVIINVVPLPKALLAVIFPLCRSTIFLQMASPMPTPS
jgi:hypothetical protein